MTISERSTIVDLIQERVQEAPDSWAVVSSGRCLSYAELDLESNRLAHLLIQLGTRPADIVAVLLGPGPELYTSILGILKACAAYLPLDVRDPEYRASLMLRTANCRTVITIAQFADRFDATGCDVVCLDAIHSANLPGILPDRLPGSGDVAYLMHTSGSTGVPKGVLVEHGSVLNLTLWAVTAFDIGRDSRMMQFHRAWFDASVQEIFSALAGGAILFPVDERIKMSPRLLLAWMRAKSITHCDLTPSYLSEILLEAAASGDAHRNLLPELEVMILGGEPLRSDHVAEWFARMPDSHRVFNLYGPTEATVTASWHPVGRTLPANIPIGRPIPNTAMWILDENGVPCADGEVGEIHIGGAGLARGYLNDPHATDSAFGRRTLANEGGGRLYCTGDLGRSMPGGLDFEFIGRIDDQINLHGNRIGLGEIDTAMRRCPGVIECATIPPVDESGVAIALVGYFTSAPPGVSARSVDNFIRAHLPASMVPRTLVSCTALPRTHAGKIDRAALAGRSTSDWRHME